MESGTIDCTVRVGDGDVVRMIGNVTKVEKVVLQMQQAEREKWHAFSDSEVPPESAYYLVYIPYNIALDTGDYLDMAYWNGDTARWSEQKFLPLAPRHWKQLPAMPV